MGISSRESESKASTNLWESMLRDAMRRNRLPDSTLILVGPQGCGKSSLLDTFLEGAAFTANPSGAAAAVAAVTSASEVGAADASAGSAGEAGHQAAAARGFHPVLAYSYLDAIDPSEQGPERDDSPPRVSVWCCSEFEFDSLLQTVLRPNSLSNAVAILAVDLSKPWSLMDSAEKWIGVLEKHVTHLTSQLSIGAQDDLRAAVKSRITAARKPGAGMQTVDVPSDLQDTEPERNLGVPIVVVGCKSDSLQSDTFDQQQRLHFIQQNLRRFCLKYGAALVYTSAKEGTNCELLRRYLLSCLYPGAFTCAEEGQTNDAVFIPSGWDSEHLIDGLLSPHKTPWGPNAAFEVVIPPKPTETGSIMGGSGTDSGVDPVEEESETIQPEETWLLILGKQVPGSEGKSRWPAAVAAVSRANKAANTAKAHNTNPANVPDPRSFFASLLASGTSPQKPQQKK